MGELLNSKKVVQQVVNRVAPMEACALGSTPAVAVGVCWIGAGASGVAPLLSGQTLN